MSEIIKSIDKISLVALVAVDKNIFGMIEIIAIVCRVPKFYTKTYSIRRNDNIQIVKVHDTRNNWNTPA